jgi:hypothetical protein
MKKQLFLTALMAVTAFSAHASDHNKKIESYQNNALAIATVSAIFTAGFALRAGVARVSLNRLVAIASAKETDRGVFWGSEKVDNLVTRVRNGRRNAKIAATITATATTAFVGLEYLKNNA